LGFQWRGIFAVTDPRECGGVLLDGIHLEACHREAVGQSRRGDVDVDVVFKPP